YVGRVYSGRAVVLYIAGAKVRVCADDGSLVGQLILDPARRYQSLSRQGLVADQPRERSTMS
ncbi:MAG TPA: hypothetical protein VMU49_08415, partial [Candidatus Acidoferrales bacterium]|nr:hypothetical protein [Candidatus Acidoferrales bacterium]